MFIVRCPESNAVQVAQEYQFGGYILFACDFGSYSRDQVQSHIQNYQKAAKIPMIIGVDEEGGTVNRVSLYKQFRAVPFHSPRSLYNEGGYALVKSDTKEKADLLCCTDYQTQYPAVVEAVKSGKISEKRIDESVLRILQYKIDAGLIK